MPKNKSQHFVPQHYLRQFRIQGTNQIATMRIDPPKYIPAASISGQCQEDYFYRGDGCLDEILTKMETDLAPVLISVTTRATFDKSDESGLGLFAVVLRARNRKVVETAKLPPKYLAKRIIGNAIANGEIPPSPVENLEDIIDFQGVAEMLGSAMILPCSLELKSLTCKLLKAVAGKYFITSDNPVVLLNQYFANKSDIQSYVGFSRSGFQLLLPISPSLCVFFYDHKVYRVGPRGDKVVPLNGQDVDLVNAMQVQSAERCLYFHDAQLERYVSRLLADYGRLRQRIQDSMQSIKDASGKTELLHFRELPLRIPKPWAFCRQRRHVKVGANNRRDPIWTMAISQLMDDLKQNPVGDDYKVRLERILGRLNTH